MSAVLGKTFSYLAHGVSSAVANASGAGDASALFAAPSADGNPEAGLKPDTARVLETLGKTPPGRASVQAAADQLAKLDASSSNSG